MNWTTFSYQKSFRAIFVRMSIGSAKFMVTDRNWKSHFFEDQFCRIRIEAKLFESTGKKLNSPPSFNLEKGLTNESHSEFFIWNNLMTFPSSIYVNSTMDSLFMGSVFLNNSSKKIWLISVAIFYIINLLH